MITGIGFAGRMHAGKDTAATLLCISEVNTRHMFQMVSIAKPIKDICIDVLQLSKFRCYDQDGKDIQTIYGKTTREIMQIIGQSFRDKINPEIWTILAGIRLKELIRKGYFFMVTDVRYPNEAEMIKELGGKIIRIDRKAVEPPKGTIDHPSEIPLPDKLCDYIVKNNRSTNCLQKRMIEIYKKEMQL